MVGCGQVKHADAGGAAGEFQIAFCEQAGDGGAIGIRVFILHGGIVRPGLHVINETQSADVGRVA